MNSNLNNKELKFGTTVKILKTGFYHGLIGVLTKEYISLPAGSINPVTTYVVSFSKFNFQYKSSFMSVDIEKLETIL